MTRERSFHAYYDKIYQAKKDYQAEADTVLRIAERLLGRPVKRLLDVGCGTGTHAFKFAQRGVEVFGVDTDAPAIDIARDKALRAECDSVRFMAGDIAQVQGDAFDCAAALFNVVNYIDTIQDLLALFGNIRDRLTVDGVLVFDCWNGLAALSEPPRDEDRQVVVDGETIEISIRPHVDLLAQKVRVENQIEAGAPGHRTFSHRFIYEQRLWTPQILRDLLGMTGFSVARVSTWNEPGGSIAADTWKILFSCQRMPDAAGR
jgi:SAM-dependent methyltransferase